MADTKTPEKDKAETTKVATPARDTRQTGSLMNDDALTDEQKNRTEEKQREMDKEGLPDPSLRRPEIGGVQVTQRLLDDLKEKLEDSDLQDEVSTDDGFPSSPEVDELRDKLSDRDAYLAEKAAFHADLPVVDVEGKPPKTPAAIADAEGDNPAKANKS